METEDPPALTEHPQPDVRASRDSNSPLASTTTAIRSNGQQLSDSGSTIASCIKCNVDVAEVFNGWLQITGSYYLPFFEGSYRITGLHAKGKPKLAASESALQGCTIQPLVCNNCEDTLAIICVQAPEGKSAYAERKFFKLPKIRLRSESTGNSVDAIVESDHAVISSKHHDATGAAEMDRSGEVTTAIQQKPYLPSMAVLGQKPSEHLSRKDLPPPRPSPSQPLQPKSILAEREIHAHPASQQASHTFVAPSPMSAPQVPSPQLNGGAGALGLPHELVVKLDAIDRLQTQTSFNRAALETCTRDMNRLENGFQQIQADFRHALEAMRNELHSLRQHVAAQVQPNRIDDHSLEVFSSTLSQVVAKTAETDIFKVEFEVVKRKVQNLERGISSPAIVAPGYQPHQRTTSVHQSVAGPHGHPVPVQARLPSSEPRLLPSQPAPTPLPTQQPVTQPPQPPQEQGGAPGWVTVNSGTKRPLVSNSDAIGTPIGSPKRARVASAETRYSRAEQMGATAATMQHHRMDVDVPTSSQANHTQTPDSYPDATHPSTFVPYTQDGVPDDSWRPESQRAISGEGSSPRGRGRGGRGRPGRPRKSLPLEPHIIGTPEWEKEGWTGSQVDSDGFYRGGIAKRGSGGGHVLAMSPVSSMDQYGHQKRSRTKPVRNAEGILIRKDGRPDMRSQSSAANLRKVHAKKEEERLASGGTPGEASHTDETPNVEEARSVAESPTSNDSRGVEPSNTQDRAEHIMKQMFPKGVELERARLQTAHRYFNSDQSPVDTAVSATYQRTASEEPSAQSAKSAQRAETAQSSESDKVRHESPQQHDEVMHDASAVDVTSVHPTPHDSPSPPHLHPAAPSTELGGSSVLTSQPTISSTTVQAS